ATKNVLPFIDSLWLKFTIAVAEPSQRLYEPPPIRFRDVFYFVVEAIARIEESGFPLLLSISPRTSPIAQRAATWESVPKQIRILVPDTNEAFLFAIAGLWYADLSLKFINGCEKPHCEVGDST